MNRVYHAAGLGLPDVERQLVTTVTLREWDEGHTIVGVYVRGQRAGHLMCDPQDADALARRLLGTKYAAALRGAFPPVVHDPCTNPGRHGIVLPPGKPGQNDAV